MDKRVAMALGAALLAAMGTALAQDGVSFVNEGVVNAPVESVAMRRFFEAGNQQTITLLQKRFGPQPEAK